MFFCFEQRSSSGPIHYTVLISCKRISNHHTIVQGNRRALSWLLLHGFYFLMTKFPAGPKNLSPPPTQNPTLGGMGKQMSTAAQAAFDTYAQTHASLAAQAQVCFAADEFGLWDWLFVIFIAIFSLLVMYGFCCKGFESSHL